VNPDGRTRWRLFVDPIRCTGRGLCAEIVPEAIQLDDWGYPIVSDGPVGAEVLRHARRAVAACPELALMLEEAPPSERPECAETPVTRGNTENSPGPGRRPATGSPAVNARSARCGRSDQ